MHPRVRTSQPKPALVCLPCVVCSKSWRPSANPIARQTAPALFCTELGLRIDSDKTSLLSWGISCKCYVFSPVGLRYCLPQPWESIMHACTRTTQARHENEGGTVVILSPLSVASGVIVASAPCRRAAAGVSCWPQSACIVQCLPSYSGCLKWSFVPGFF